MVCDDSFPTCRGNNCTRKTASPRSRLCPVCFLTQAAKSGRAGGRASSGKCKVKSGRASSGNTTTGKCKVKAGRDSSGNTTTGKCKVKAGVRSGYKRITKALLVVKQPWLDLLLSGKKRWEIRGQSTHKRGWVHLAESGCGGYILGRARLTLSLIHI